MTIAKMSSDRQGVEASCVTVDNLAQIIRNVKLSKEGYIYLLDPSRKYIYHPLGKSGEHEENRVCYQ
ncbi:PDC sensor domain-containing protein [Paenibacillus alginolyticus]|uniref:Cache domain-containing protein n=1 Tax=Paenibacillus alginolyticus TaxID=59839 RepID=A0ABT4GAK9_9BACL|nr:hypothetical protein [Paenibacillus alginolyticus]MCY9693203.1 hypothetical protein [Paenibacillus alginolyticus]MEC0146028.1 hypothetical protein [Paenibacillus alginolyticus]